MFRNECKDKGWRPGHVKTEASQKEMNDPRTAGTLCLEPVESNITRDASSPQTDATYKDMPIKIP